VWDDLGVDLSGVVLCYGDHIGDPRLREVIAAEHSGISADDVLVTPGAAAALFIVNTALCGRGDHVIVAHPNYVTNVETPRAIGAHIDFLPLRFEDQWRVDVERLASMIRPQTRLVSLTSPHNPTGAVIPEADLQRVVELVAECHGYLLLDETYRDMAFDPPPLLAASLHPRVISVSSLSKSYGLPGIRLGWLVNRDPVLMETFLAAKEQIFICGSVIDEAIGAHVLAHKDQWLTEIKPQIEERLATVRAWLERTPALEWVEPQGGVVGFPRIRPGLDVDVDAFYHLLVERYQTFVGPGHWFDMDRRYMRIGFGWPSTEELAAGLDCVTRALDDAHAARP
jgi:aspartate/methionine/tyrosine aminotransferase